MPRPAKWRGRALTLLLFLASRTGASGDDCGEAPTCGDYTRTCKLVALDSSWDSPAPSFSLTGPIAAAECGCNAGSWAPKVQLQCTVAGGWDCAPIVAAAPCVACGLPGAPPQGTSVSSCSAISTIARSCVCSSAAGLWGAVTQQCFDTGWATAGTCNVCRPPSQNGGLQLLSQTTSTTNVTGSVVTAVSQFTSTCRAGYYNQAAASSAGAGTGDMVTSVCQPSDGTFLPLPACKACDDSLVSSFTSGIGTTYRPALVPGAVCRPTSTATRLGGGADIPSALQCSCDTGYTGPGFVGTCRAGRGWVYSPVANGTTGTNSSSSSSGWVPVCTPCPAPPTTARNGTVLFEAMDASGVGVALYACRQGTYGPRVLASCPFGEGGEGLWGPFPACRACLAPVEATANGSNITIGGVAPPVLPDGVTFADAASAAAAAASLNLTAAVAAPASVSLACRTGWWGTPTTAACVRDATAPAWAPLPVCVACALPPQGAGVMAQPVSAASYRLSCGPGWWGASTLSTCSNTTGVWSTPAITCSKCVSPVNASAGEQLLSVVASGTDGAPAVVSVGCVAGLAPPSSSQPSTTLRACNSQDGSWSGAPLVCVGAAATPGPSASSSPRGPGGYYAGVADASSGASGSASGQVSSTSGLTPAQTGIAVGVSLGVALAVAVYWGCRKYNRAVLASRMEAAALKAQQAQLEATVAALAAGSQALPVGDGTAAPSDFSFDLAAATARSLASNRARGPPPFALSAVPAVPASAIVNEHERRAARDKLFASLGVALPTHLQQQQRKGGEAAQGAGIAKELPAPLAAANSRRASVTGFVPVAATPNAAWLALATDTTVPSLSTARGGRGGGTSSAEAMAQHPAPAGFAAHEFDGGSNSQWAAPSALPQDTTAALAQELAEAEADLEAIRREQAWQQHQQQQLQQQHLQQQHLQQQAGPSYLQQDSYSTSAYVPTPNGFEEAYYQQQQQQAYYQQQQQQAYDYQQQQQAYDQQQQQQPVPYAQWTGNSWEQEPSFAPPPYAYAPPPAPVAPAPPAIQPLPGGSFIVPAGLMSFMAPQQQQQQPLMSTVLPQLSAGAAGSALSHAGRPLLSLALPSIALPSSVGGGGEARGRGRDRPAPLALPLALPPLPGRLPPSSGSAAALPGAMHSPPHNSTPAPRRASSPRSPPGSLPPHMRYR